MKKGLFVVLCVCALFASCKGKSGEAKEDEYKLSKDESYALGMAVAHQVRLEDAPFTLDYKEVSNGFKAVLEGSDTRIKEVEVEKFLSAAFEEVDKRSRVKNEDALVKAKNFMDENSKKTGVVTTESGLQYEIIKEGNGAKPSVDNSVLADYVGTLTNGEIFDSSKERGEPAEFNLGSVIPGWTEGLQLMSEGSTYKFYIPPQLGYGEYAQPKIPANSVLIFEVDLLKIMQ
jgi:FKBP-type peptidyl-prolyl cis-trans isomerase